MITREEQEWLRREREKAERMRPDVRPSAADELEKAKAAAHQDEIIRIARAAAQGKRVEEAAQRPFQVGDVVRLKSGSFAMTVTGLHRVGCDCEGGCVDVVFTTTRRSGGTKLQTAHLNAACVELTKDISPYGDMPF